MFLISSCSQQLKESRFIHKFLKFIHKFQIWDLLSLTIQTFVSQQPKAVFFFFFFFFKKYFWKPVRPLLVQKLKPHEIEGRKFPLFFSLVFSADKFSFFSIL